MLPSESHLWGRAGPQGNCQTRFAAAIGAGPSEGPLGGLCDLARHTQKPVGGRALTDKSLQRVDACEIAVEPDRSLKAAGNRDVIGEGHAARRLSFSTRYAQAKSVSGLEIGLTRRTWRTPAVSDQTT